MTTMPMPREASWWTWLATAILLGTGLAGWATGFIAAVTLSLAQTLVFLARERFLIVLPVQIRLAYTALLIVCLLPGMRWLYWLPALGTAALVIFGYCLLARLLSLLPWNRREPLTPSLLRRTFLNPPVRNAPRHGLPTCRCHLEARAATTLGPRASSSPPEAPRQACRPALHQRSSAP